MKLHLVLIIVIVGLPFAVAQPVDYIAFWAFEDPITDQQASDSSVFGNDMSCTSCPSTTAGLVGQGYDFSTDWLFRTDSQLQGAFPSKSSGAATSFTISSWIRMDSINDRQPILSKQTSPSPTGRGFVFMKESDHKLKFESWVGGVEKEVKSSQSLSAGTTYHVVFTYDQVSDTGTLYIDGVQDGQMVGMGGPPQPNAADLDIGRYYWSSTYARYFDGIIDEVMVFDYALSAGDIVDLFLSEGGSVCGDLVCDGLETSCTCAQDCGSSCGDGCVSGTEVCEPSDSQSCSSGAYTGTQVCLSDCSGFGTCQTGFCGDLLCEIPPEDAASCGDCFCGDGLCDPSETLASCSSDCSTSTCSTVTKDGISFTFDQSYPCGQFITGDWWVTPLTPGGTVRITAMSPTGSPGRHGGMVNPTSNKFQGFDDRIVPWFDYYDPTLDITTVLPYDASGGESIIKTESKHPEYWNGCKETPGGTSYSGEDRSCIARAAVLTVLDTTPPNNGANVFRPPYFGAAKPLYFWDDVVPQLSLLPELDPVSSTPSIAWLEQHTIHPVLSIDRTGGDGSSAEYMRPDAWTSAYSAAWARDNHKILLRLMVKGTPTETIQDKEASIRGFIQIGIDQFAVGQELSWWANAGMHLGRAAPILFAATMLDDQTMKSWISTVSPGQFQERGQMFSTPQSGEVLWGDTVLCTELSYWTDISNYPGNGKKTCKDPYGYIDGGWNPGSTTGGYQYCCSSLPIKAFSMALIIMPELRQVWNNDATITYAERWQSFGAYTQPDPCAPYDGNYGGDLSGYGVSYGPDGSGGCILDTNPSDGTGRFPGGHGSLSGSGTWDDPFHANMWTTYYDLFSESQTCSDLGGFLCPAGDYCQGTEIPSSDPGICCDSAAACKTPLCGDQFLDPGEECDGSDFGVYGDGVGACPLYDPTFVSGDLSCASCAITTENCAGEASCADQGGTLCAPGETCSETSIPSSDPGVCCLDTCESVQTCSDLGGDLCTLSEYCPGGEISDPDPGVCCDIPCLPLPQKVGNWTLDDGIGGTAADTSGADNHGTVSGPLWSSTCVEGTCLDYTSLSDTTTVTTSFWTPTQGSLLLWARPEAFPVLDGSYYLFGHTTTPAYANRIQLYLTSDGQLNLGLGDTHDLAVAIAPAVLNAWHHVALVWDGSSYTLSIDGVPFVAGSYSGLDQIAPTADIGNNGFDQSEGFNGKIDQVLIYSVPLTQQDITDLIQGGAPQTCQDQGGILCSGNEFCSGTELPAIDGLCCSLACDSHPLPELYNLTPENFTNNVTTNITITGFNFSDSYTLLLDGLSISYTPLLSDAFNHTNLTVMNGTPAGTYQVQVQNPTGLLSNTLTFEVLSSSDSEVCDDLDSDTYTDALCGGSDCNDNNPAINPGASDVCGDGIDQDCSGGDLVCPPSGGGGGGSGGGGGYTPPSDSGDDVPEDGPDTSPPSCEEDDTQPCGSNIGACEEGVRTCVGGVWGACVGGVEPLAEDVCFNQLDDDCDTEVDEECELAVDTCSNQQLDENEEGVDCGGVCPMDCQQQQDFTLVVASLAILLLIGAVLVIKASMSRSLIR